MKRSGWTLLFDADTMAQIDMTCRSDASHENSREACGFLAGGMLNHQYAVQLAIPVPNSSRGDRSHHYQISASDFIEVESSLRPQGLDIVGVYHSHPNGRAEPSQLDIDYFFPGWVYLIIGIAPSGAIEHRAFHLSGDAAREVAQVELKYRRQP